MNPHQRLVMQESWNALEDAGLRPEVAGGQPHRHSSSARSRARIRRRHFHRRVRRHHRLAAVLRARLQRPRVRRQHGLFVFGGGDPPRLRKPAQRGIRPRARGRRQRLHAPGHPGPPRSDRDAVAKRPLLHVRPGGRRHDHLGRRRHGRAEAPRRRHRGGRPDLRDDLRLGDEPGRRQQRHHGAERRGPGAAHRERLRPLRDRSGTDQLRRGARHGHEAGRPGGDQCAGAGVPQVPARRPAGARWAAPSRTSATRRQRPASSASSRCCCRCGTASYPSC